MKINLYERSSVLFRKGDLPKMAYVILTGVVNFYDDRKEGEDVNGIFEKESPWENTLLESGDSL